MWVVWDCCSDDDLGDKVGSIVPSRRFLNLIYRVA